MNSGNIKVLGYFLIFGWLFLASSAQLNAQRMNRDTSQLRFPLNESRLPYQSPNTPPGMQLKPPSNLNKTIEFDPKTNQYVITEKIGQTNYTAPYNMSIQEYQQYEIKNSSKQYWDERSRSDRQTGSSTFMPSLNIGMEAFDKIFGTNTINIVPQGSAELIFGLNTSKINNPNISERLRKTTTFDFQEKIQMNVTGTIGDKMKLGVRYDTEATFESENQTKLEYTGKEDEIIRKVEAGNVTLPLTGSLITGSQSLFGIKTELQFGKLNVVTVFSQQKGESSVIDVKGGAQISEFEVEASEYEDLKHFFVAHYFRNRFEKALEKLPIINSPITITKMEVWVTNQSNNFENPRNIVAFMDLAEARPSNSSILVNPPLDSENPPRNATNKLYDQVKDNIRNYEGITGYLTGLGFREGNDYEMKATAQKLRETEYTFHPTLGYVSLKTRLRPDDVLAIAYEFTYMGKTYKVGEFASDLSSDKQTLAVKLIKGINLNPQLPNWDLMMKNVYSLGAYQVNQEDFILDVVYQDDKSGTTINYLPEDKLSKQILLRELGLDKLNSQLDPVASGDGVFDFIPNVTIYPDNGRMVFPKLEPFGKTISEFIQKNGMDSAQYSKYIYQELYDLTLTNAKLKAEKNKYKLRGTYKSSVSSEIPLNAFNVPEGSVVVTAGGMKLNEGSDYTVDYTMGRVKILNQGLLESGTPIRVSLESNSLFNFQTKTLIGTHLDYKFSDNFNLGATIINLTERPLTEKVNIGDEPISNTIWGLNGSYTTTSQFLTTMVDKLPFLQTKEPSTITVDGEFAHLIPGHSRALGKAGAAYIDDFEGSETPYDLRQPSYWTLASVPKIPELFPESSDSYIGTVEAGKNRAKLAWYSIDQIFTRESSNVPSGTNTSSFFVKELDESQLFKNKRDNSGMVTSMQILNLAFYPKERGPYNYFTEYTDPASIPNRNPQFLDNPQRRWAGIQRELVNTDFEAANVEFIEFWMLDPYCEDPQSTNKGSLYFNLGNVSEDVLKDSRKAFENGLPTFIDTTGKLTTNTAWGKVSNSLSIVPSFVGGDPERPYQDIGLDGLNNNDEKSFFQTFLSDLAALNLNTSAIAKDPSSDDFEYFRSPNYDSRSAGILERYKKYNGLENNSPSLGNKDIDYSPSSTFTPNTEDINKDNSLDTDESFYQYKVDIDKDKLKVGTNFIVDQVEVTARDDGKKANWFQFRIPVTEFQRVIGNIDGFTSIRFMRMYLHGFEDSVILRFARIELIRGEWRRYMLSMFQNGEIVSAPDDEETSFEITSVNIEENGSKIPVNYVLPPGVSRQVDPNNPQLNELNEQAMVLKVRELNNGDARVAYKNANLDIRQYRRLKMDVHAERLENNILNDNELTVFIRLGSDYKNNYYEYEVPLKVTPPNMPGTFYDNDNEDDRRIVWPEENAIDIALEDFQRAKQARNDESRKPGSEVTALTPFNFVIEGRRGKYQIRGNPNLSNIRTIMVGVRYPHNPQLNGHTRSAEIWVNELRLTDFNEQGGWAANLRVTSKLADFATVSLAGTTSKPGFGSIEKKVNERSKEELYQYDVASNIELGKFFPQKSGIQIPMYLGISETFINPQYNPLDPDIELKASLKNAASDEEREEIRKKVQDYTRRKSINFTNVRINKTGGTPHFYDVSNWTVNYGYNESFSRNINVEKRLEKHFTGGIMYQYQLRPKTVTPFQKLSFLKGNSTRLIRDFNFNYLPTSFAFRTDMSRSYSETKLRNLNNPQQRIDSTVTKDFLWNRHYELSYDITRQLKLDFSASNTARIDEPAGAVNRAYKDRYEHWKDSVWNNIKSGGRTTYYQHDFRINYNVPINKIPLLDWTSANMNYTSTYDWNAAPLTQDTSANIGNTISNSGTLTSTGQINLTSLYNKVPYFRRLFQTQNQNQANQKKKTKKITFEKDKVNLFANSPKSFTHKLKSQEIKIKVTDTAGSEIKGKLKVINDNKVSFTPEVDYRGAKVLIEATVAEKPNPIVIASEHVTRAILGVKNISISWSRMKGSTMPGFMPKTKLMGMSNGNSYYAPGLGFILGIVDKEFAQKTIEKNWLTRSTYLNDPYTITANDNVSVRSNVEPFSGFKIEVTGSWNHTNTTSSYFQPEERKFTNPIESGNFSMSFIALGNAFEKVVYKEGKYTSAVFAKFLQNRAVIARRLGEAMDSKVNNPMRYKPDDPNFTTGDGGSNGYNLASQEVLIPAFMSAYGGLDPNKVTLDRFPSVFKMMPNWRITYEGLSKIPFVKKYARSVSLNHQYRATYNVGSYITNAAAQEDIDIYLSNLRDLQNNFIPKYDASSVSITEQLSPLISIDINFINSLSTRFELKRSRNIVLSVSNIQITENLSNEFVIGAGYKITDFKFSLIQSTAGTKNVSSDLNLRGDFSIRDNKMIIRKLSDDPDQGAQGQKVLSIKLSADYNVSDNFNLRMFYDRIVNTPFVTLSHPTANTNFGFSIRFSLTQ